MTRVKIESGKSWESFCRALPSSPPQSSSRMKSSSYLSFLTSRTAFPPNRPLSFETATHIERGSKETKRKVILTQKSGLLLVAVLLQRWGTGVAKGTWNTGLPRSWTPQLPGPRGEKVSVTQTLPWLRFWSGEKRSKGEHPSAMGRRGH